MPPQESASCDCDSLLILQVRPPRGGTHLPTDHDYVGGPGAQPVWCATDAGALHLWRQRGECFHHSVLGCGPPVSDPCGGYPRYERVNLVRGRGVLPFAFFSHADVVPP